MKKHLLNSTERTLPYCKLRSFLNLQLILPNNCVLKMCLTKKLCCVIVNSSKDNSCNAIYYCKTNVIFTYGYERMEISQEASKNHLLTCDCNKNFNDFTISSKDSIKFNFLIKESSLAVPDNPILNKTVKLFPLELSNSTLSIIIVRS